MTFHWNWNSTKGRERTENQDFSGIADGEEFLIAVIADGVFSRPGSGELAKDFVQFLVRQAVSINTLPEIQDVLEWVKEAFEELKCETQPKSSISFLVACFSPSHLLFTINAGDCRIGVINDAGQIVWKNNVHSLATATLPLSEDALREHPARNQLTRTFSTKRFVEPEVTHIYCEYPVGAILASDGFWAGLPPKNQHDALVSEGAVETASEDDVSRLLIGRANHCEAGHCTHNFYVVKRSPDNSGPVEVMISDFPL
jgi:serine/threonine protein phosphatase PrpC